MDITIEDLKCSSDTHSSYSVNINDEKISTIVTHTASIVDEYISSVLQTRPHELDHLLVGLDVEWLPNTSKKEENPVATLQLCIDRKCLIFQFIYASGIPQSLIDFLNNPAHKFTGVKIKEDIRKLRKDYSLEVANSVDLRDWAAGKLKNTQLEKAGLKSLAKEVLDLEIPKPKKVSWSKWDSKSLTDDQVQYACVDAFLSFQIGKKLMELP